MWKKGNPLVIHSKDTTIEWRILTNISGSLLFILVSFIAFVIITQLMKGDRAVVFALLILGVIIAFGYLVATIIYSSYYPTDSTITIGKEGIAISEGEVYEWKDIEYAYPYFDEMEMSQVQQMSSLALKAAVQFVIKTGKSNSRSKKEKEIFLHVIYRDSNNEQCHSKINLNKHDYNSQEIVDAVEYWSGRDIGEKSDVIRDEFVQDQVESGNMTEEEAVAETQKISQLTPLFKDFSSDFIMSSLARLPIMLVGVVILEVLMTETPYDKETWYRCVKICSYILGNSAIYIAFMSMNYKKRLKAFRSKPEIQQLTEEEFDTYLNIASNKAEKATSSEFQEIGEMLLKYATVFFIAVWVAYVIFLSLYKFGVLS